MFVSFGGHLSGFQVFRELGGPNGKKQKWQRSKFNPSDMQGCGHLQFMLKRVQCNVNGNVQYSLLF